ncbi:hypothetical protein LJC58_04300 [Lachnospiraceae bacterium OttesenSCG-928-D06]|nr:hypothetical protein [Lachnospiraceae bacterium OttesenSCG-928-D06]
MNRRKYGFAVLSLLVIALAGCGKTGDANEGDCHLAVSMETIPKELNYVNENLYDNLSVFVNLENLANENHYKVALNAENDFSEDLYLNPGEYRITSCYTSPSGLQVLSVDTRQEKVSLSYEEEDELDVFIDNYDAYIQWVNHNVAGAEILQSDKFSRKVQIQGEMVLLDELMEKYVFAPESNMETVYPYKEIEVKNKDLGITLTLQNQTSESLSYKQCTVIGATFNGNHVILGGGVRLGMDITSVSHDKTGIYGIPDYCKGTVLIGTGYDSTDMIYLDEKSGDRITLTYHPERNYIMTIHYEYAMFE